MPVSSRCQRAVPVLALAVLALLVSGCVHHRHTRTHVHRVHQHGEITHHNGVVIIFDGGLGCYVVRDHPGHYFFDGRFYRYRAGSWYGASRVAGPWVAARVQALPARLRENHGQRVREAAHERNAERHEAIRDQREERHDARMERREAVAEQRREDPVERREQVQEPRAGRQGVAKERRAEPHPPASAEEAEGPEEAAEERPRRHRRDARR